MESCSLQPSSVTTIVTSLTKAKAGFIEKSSLHGQLLRFPNFIRHPNARKLKLFTVKAQTSGATKFSSQIVEAIPGDVGQKDEKLAFVSGATGRVGSRTVRELLKLGFRVKAAVRSAQRAETLVQSVKNLKVDPEGAQPIERLEIVECDLEKQDQIVPSLGNASIVVCCIGASEKEVFDITGPYRIDYQATKNLIDAATTANVNHFIMVSSLGTNKIGFPAAILNLFWGVLIWKRKAEEALIASGLPYTIVRPGGMERPTDAYKETHNITLSEEDTLFGGQVSNLQVAELIAFMAKNSDLSYCKVVEVIAETTAPLTPLDKLLAMIPSQRTRPKGSDSADMPMVEPTTDIVTEASSTISKEPSVKVKVSSPLSPYTAYEDLKPPTSPTPSAPTGQQIISSPIDAASPVSSDAQTSSSETAPEITETKPAMIGMPLSPYVVYEDLKPLTSPNPTPSGPKEVATGASTPPTGGNDVATVIVNSNPMPDSASRHSPFLVYDDLKPPTSPSPTAPVGSFQSAYYEGPKIGNTAPSPASVNEVHQIEPKPKPKPKPKQKPLSPYTMYEDLKPPTSPRPPLEKLK